MLISPNMDEPPRFPPSAVRDRFLAIPPVDRRRSRQAIWWPQSRPGIGLQPAANGPAPSYAAPRPNQALEAPPGWFPTLEEEIWVIARTSEPAAQKGLKDIPVLPFLIWETLFSSKFCPADALVSWTEEVRGAL